MENTQHEKSVHLLNGFTDGDEPPSKVTVSLDDSEVSFCPSKVGARTVKERINLGVCSRDFSAKHFYQTTNWQWQMENGDTTHVQPAKIIDVFTEEINAITDPKSLQTQEIAPYCAGIMSTNHPKQGLRQKVGPIENGLIAIYAKLAIAKHNV